MKLSIFITITLATVSIVHAEKSYTSIPASAFSPSDTFYGHSTNGTGTTRFFNRKLFAPVNLPHKSIVTSLTCGAKPSHGFVVDIKLRRNDPQQANVDMTWIGTSYSSISPGNKIRGLAEYQFINTNEIWPNLINNQRYNYYIEVSLRNPDPNDSELSLQCPSGIFCGSINFCRLEYKAVPPPSGK